MTTVQREWIKEVYKAISLKDLYARTGIQKADYNTIYQLMAVKKKHPEYLEQAETLLHVPDYFPFPSYRTENL